ncbi:MAG: HD domain-containing protein [Ruminococcus sp.]
MIYTDLTKKALKISFNAHKNQVDKSGMPYVFHPFHLAEQMDDEYSVCVALLHDVIEDTDIMIEDLEAEGFPKEVINAIELLTHSDSVPYLDYVKTIKNNSIARKVKLADLKHNSDLSRLDNIDDKALERVEKYKKAIEILQES